MKGELRVVRSDGGWSGCIQVPRGNRSKNHKGKLMVGLQGGGMLQLFIYTI